MDRTLWKTPLVLKGLNITTIPFYNVLYHEFDMFRQFRLDQILVSALWKKSLFMFLSNLKLLQIVQQSSYH